MATATAGACKSAWELAAEEIVEVHRAYDARSKAENELRAACRRLADLLVRTRSEDSAFDFHEAQATPWGDNRMPNGLTLEAADFAAFLANDHESDPDLLDVVQLTEKVRVAHDAAGPSDEQRR